MRDNNPSQSCRLHLILIAVGSVVLMSVVLWHVNVVNRHILEKKYLSFFNEQRVLTLRMVKYAAEASDARVEGFALLKGAREEFGQNLIDLRQGDPKTALPPLPAATEQELNALESRWGDFSYNAELILSAERTIRILKEFARAINDVLLSLVKVSDDIARSLLKKGADPQLVYLASRQLLLSQRIEASANKFFQGGEIAAQAIDQFGRDAATFSRVLEGMLQGDPDLGLRKVSNVNIRKELQKASNLLRTTKELMAKILQLSPDMFKAQEATNKIFVLSDGLVADIELLFERYQLNRL